ncbi:MAG: SPASM domain-containing protein [Desulfobulbaceae bacterium]|nr:SPASM domain-containing protein [Desulfobulbaceae bacterium]
MMLEHNGDIYFCDHNMYPIYLLGNIKYDDPMQLAQKVDEQNFYFLKEPLSDYCRQCPVLHACWGGCPKHRFAKTWDETSRLNYLCVGYKKYFLYIRKYLHLIAQLLQKGLPASHIMQVIKGPLIIPNNQQHKS